MFQNRTIVVTSWIVREGWRSVRLQPDLVTRSTMPIDLGVDKNQVLA